MTNVAIIGAGVSGLSAAIELQKKDISFTIYEASDRIGGRMKTDRIDGFQLDHGFQVLQTAYPIAQEVLDFDALELGNFFPGAKVFHNGKWRLIGDPIRNPEVFISTISSGISNMSDSMKILKLRDTLKSKTVNEIFSGEDNSTLDYLKQKGFSDHIIDTFFKPFFSGIFLEPELSTSSKMFAFVFKMFGEGFAALPKNGMQAIPDQLAEKLSSESIKLNHKLIEIKNGELIFENSYNQKHDYVVNATNWSSFDQLNPIDQNAQQTHNLYFTSNNPIDKRGIIHLNGTGAGLISNISFPNAIQESYAPDGKHLMSITVLSKGDLSDAELFDSVKDELKIYFGSSSSDWTFLKHYFIPKALPEKKTINIPFELSRAFNGLEMIQAGDASYYGSLNAALLSGKRAAKAILA